MARVYLGLGSNIDAEDNLRLGINELRSRYGSVDLSGVYQSAALGFEGDDFWNMVVGLTSEQSPLDIQRQIEEIHALSGRRRGADRLTSRPLDIDLLMYGDIVSAEPSLRLPRPDILEYSFVLRPFAELAPDIVHPETGRSLAAHWRDFDATCHPLTPVRVIL
jgi:2-amino-4-hydroxy-6-hydroxymethyldihydropteridine diphosphokinase